ncbi:hypothetical protein ACFTWH_03660 [Streptomyces sp. NPDC057011]|uniref:hypothetical protein n=1 Tax=unclassified Streptomyces TaxID=2593676 RepID=UPI00363E925E
MSKSKHNPRPTPPSKAPGESGDVEARRQADEAVLSRSKEGEAGDALTPSPDAQRRADRNTKKSARKANDQR